MRSRAQLLARQAARAASTGILQAGPRLSAGPSSVSAVLPERGPAACISCSPWERHMEPGSGKAQP